MEHKKKRSVAICLVLPHQLFSDIEWMAAADEVIIYEEPLFFTEHRYHKLTLFYKRAAMKLYQEYLKEQLSAKIKYIEFSEDIFDIIKTPAAQMPDPVEHSLQKKYRDFEFIDCGYFLSPDFTSSKKIGQAEFYKAQRKKFGYLIDKESGGPSGGRWSYDIYNREGRIREKEIAKPPAFSRNAAAFDEAEKYIERHFADNPGLLDTRADIFPITHKEAAKAVDIFVKERLLLFGKYQDAVHSNMTAGWHSCLSAALNCGLITPRDILRRLEYYCKKRGIKIAASGRRIIVDLFGKEVRPTDKKAAAPYNIADVEAYLRQLIGWREYIHYTYDIYGEKMRRTNIFAHKRSLGPQWWGEGSLGLPPIDYVINKVRKYAYAHHIERLMFVGSAMLMCGIRPNDVYEWFISFCSIDAYDWVMVPNVYGMSQHSCGKFIMSRPYFSSAAYIKKMSDFSFTKGSDIYNSLYYNFIAEHSLYLKTIYATASAVSQYNKKSKGEKAAIRQTAANFINKVSGKLYKK